MQESCLNLRELENTKQGCAPPLSPSRPKRSPARTLRHKSATATLGGGPGKTWRTATTLSPPSLDTCDCLPQGKVGVHSGAQAPIPIARWLGSGGAKEPARTRP